MKKLLISAIMLCVSVCSVAQPRQVPKKTELAFANFKEKGAVFNTMMAQFHGQIDGGTLSAADGCAIASAGKELSVAGKQLIQRIKVDMPKEDSTELTVAIYKMVGLADHMGNLCRMGSAVEVITSH